MDQNKITNVQGYSNDFEQENKKPKPAIENFTIWEEHDTTEAQPVPMCLEQPETFSNDKVAQIEVEMEDVFEEALIDIDNDDANNPLAGVEYVGDLECAKLIVSYHEKAKTGGLLIGVHNKYNTSKFGYVAKVEPAYFLVQHS
ncbi:hypothetical protein MTR67_007957 [Solanum verrucosum]|uniref:Uncharacterized protein n=1 Tax=Solanum verrucosum TaxID=315347 RepID=A0AAF0TBY8_SOLVR|nr:hypothetical protein MTR67_007957 [Solanum verrucosum]